MLIKSQLTYLKPSILSHFQSEEAEPTEAEATPRRNTSRRIYRVNSTTLKMNVGQILEIHILQTKSSLKSHSETLQSLKLHDEIAIPHASPPHHTAKHTIDVVTDNRVLHKYYAVMLTYIFSCSFNTV